MHGLIYQFDNTEVFFLLLCTARHYGRATEYAREKERARAHATAVSCELGERERVV